MNNLNNESSSSTITTPELIILPSFPKDLGYLSSHFEIVIDKIDNIQNEVLKNIFEKLAIINYTSPFKNIFEEFKEFKEEFKIREHHSFSIFWTDLNIEFKGENEKKGGVKVEFSLSRYLDNKKVNAMEKIFESLENIVIKNISIGDFLDGYYTSSIINNFIKNSKFIENFVILDEGFNNNDIEKLCGILSGNKSIKSIDFRYCPNIDNNCINFIINIIKLTNIICVYTDPDKITEDLEFFSPCVINIVKNKICDLKFNSLGLKDINIDVLSDIIKEKNVDNISQINFSSNNITSIGLSKFFCCLLSSNNKNIKSIDLSYNELNDDFIKYLGEIIQTNENINKIDLSLNKITDKGIEYLSNYIIGNISIESLYLNGNKDITNNSYNIFINILNKSCITTLNLDDAKFNDEQKQNIKNMTI